MVTIENHLLKVEIDEYGAQLTSVIDKASGYEFIWQADAEYWNRHAPVLFPIVGTLKENRFEHQGEYYTLSRHGFARDTLFETQTVTDNSASFFIKSNDSTKKMYPFDFSFQISYVLHENTLTTSYEVLNPSSNEVLYYSVGGHPAFNISQTHQSRALNEFDQVSISFQPEGQYLRIPLTKEGLIDFYSSKYEFINEIPLQYKLFTKDALIYQINKETQVSLHDKTAGVHLLMKMNGMEYLGLWTPYSTRAPFICIEPWAGIADDGYTTTSFSQKRGIQSLDPHQIKSHDYSIAFTKE